MSTLDTSTTNTNTNTITNTNRVETCCICSNTLTDEFIKINILKRFYYCDRCFHIQGASNNYGYSSCGYVHRVEYFHFIIERIRMSELSLQGQIDILLISKLPRYFSEMEYVNHCENANFFFSTMCDAFDIRIQTNINMILIDQGTENEETHSLIHTQINGDLSDDKRYDIIILDDVLMKINSPKNALGDILGKWGKRDTFTYAYSLGEQIVANKQFYHLTNRYKSIFTPYSMKMLCETVTPDLNSHHPTESGVLLNKIEKLTNGNCVFELHSQLTDDTNVTNIILDGLHRELYSTEIYSNFKHECEIYKNTFHNLLLYYKIRGYKLIGYIYGDSDYDIIDYCNFFILLDRILVNSEFIEETLEMSSEDLYLFVIFPWTRERDITFNLKRMCEHQGINNQQVSFLSCNIYNFFSNSVN